MVAAMIAAWIVAAVAAYILVGIPIMLVVARILRAGSEHLDRTPTESRACVVTAKPSGGPPSLPPPPPVR
jgi:hypothetical protein